MGGAPGLSGVQSRNAAGMSSFAQTIGGGSQSHTPLDPSYAPPQDPSSRIIANATEKSTNEKISHF